MSGVYQIYNPINNKRYIGSSINVERRLKEHLRNLKKTRIVMSIFNLHIINTRMSYNFNF